VRIKWIAPAAAVAVMTMPSPAGAFPSAPLNDHANAVAEAKQERQAERSRKRERAFKATPVPAHLQAIAACESGGNPRAVSADGTYRGKYQFSYATWAAVGGAGDPAAASEAEQDTRAALLYARAGAGQWPRCGR
jgi:hypothetical protein